MYKKGLVIFLLLAGAFFARAQQDATITTLQQNFVQYQLHAMQEKIFVHIDKDFYLAGEIIWFKVYNVDESFNKPSQLSKVAYVEIISDEQKAVIQAKISLQDGAGDGSIVIPSSLASGTYKLRAYTSRMKNFGAEYFFEQSLTIINTLKGGQAKATEGKLQYHVDFFPEGGNLVNGINSIVAFKITDQYGHGVDASGVLLNSNNDTIARLQTLRLGMGNFSFTPQKEVGYKALLKVDDANIVQNIPSAYDQGYIMHLSDAEPGFLSITVNVSSAFSNLPVYLFAHTRHLLKDVQAMRIENGKAMFRVDKNKLGDGISHFTIFNADRKPVCERLYCKKPGDKLVIQASANQATYATRNKINIGVKASNVKGTPLSADMSVAVFMTDALQTSSYQDIQSWLMLQSDLTGRIESPAYYFSDNSSASAEALNNLMLTQGWRRFKWEDALTGKTPSFDFVTEYEGPVITGVITDKYTGAAKRNCLTTLTAPAENFELRSALTKDDGSVQYNVNNLYSNNELIMQAVNAADSAVKISVASPFSDKFSSAVFDKFSLPVQWKDQLLNRSINVQADNAYLSDKKKRAFDLPVADSNVFYGKTEKQYSLDDYTRFITMDEVMKELVLDVRVRKQSDGYQFRVVDGVYKTFFDQAPLVLIDGVPVSNIDKIMAFDPLKIKRIDVATHRHYLGPLIADGIVSYKTYQGDLAGFELDPSAVVIEYEGLQRQRIFFSPVYETSSQKESRIPDLRNLLFWSPQVKTAENGKQELSFYTSDIKGNFAIVVQGITADGLAGSSISTFTVDK